MHCPQVIAIATPNEMFTVTIINQTNTLIQPDEMRSTVTAKDVLLHSAARMAQVPARLDSNKKISRLAGLNCVSGRPKPRLMQTDMRALSATRES